MKTELQANIVETFKKLSEIVSKFSETEFNTVPPQGGSGRPHKLFSILFLPVPVIPNYFRAEL